MAGESSVEVNVQGCTGIDSGEPSLDDVSERPVGGMRPVDIVALFAIVANTNFSRSHKAQHEYLDRCSKAGICIRKCATIA